MKYKIEKVNDVTLLSLEGELLFEDVLMTSEMVMRELAELSIKKLVIDLSKVDTVDSCGVGFLINSHKNVLSRKGHFSLIGPAGQVKKKLEALGLLRIFVVFDSKDEAIISASKT